VRLWLSIVAYNLGNLWRRLTLPGGIEDWSLTSLQQRVVKTGGIGETRAVLLADTGGRPSDARTIRCDVATDRDAATSRELTTRDATGTKSLRPREQGVVREESTRTISVVRRIPEWRDIALPFVRKCSSGLVKSLTSSTIRVIQS